MTKLVPVTPESKQNYKRDVYEDVFAQLVQVQETYHNLARELIKKTSASIPKSKDEVEQLLASDSQIEVLNDHIGRLEEIKFLSGLALLSEGALITDSEISSAIGTTEELLGVAETEYKSEENAINKWAKQKVDLFEKIKEIFLQILEYKLNKKHKMGEMELH